MKGHHAIEQQEVLSLDDDFSLVILGDEHRKLAQVDTREVPHAPLGSGFELEARFKTVVGLVGGDHQVLLHGGTRYLPVRSLLLVERAYVSHYKASRRAWPLE